MGKKVKCERARELLEKRRSLVNEIEAAIREEVREEYRDELLAVWAMVTRGPEYAAWYGPATFDRSFQEAEKRRAASGDA